ncbi:unnamed protein product [Durusdinium trenchii]|uniref:Fe2OG dioxygenase domain-containing protein n=1 Tax=Durusdinium trenchii TaxID=1381693 RepID=A0ABP0KUD2_9DINO
MGRWVWICFVFQACVAKYAQIQQVSVAKFARGSTEEKAEQVQKLRTAFETKGMVVLVDVGFPEGLIEKTMSKSREFFELPLHLKEKHGEPSGYPPRSYGAVTVPTGKFYKTQQKDDPGNILNEWLLVKNTTVPIDWKDPYYSSDEGQEFYSSISKHPEQQQWPAEVPGLQEVTGAFYREMEKLATTMQELFALALGISKDFFSSRSQRAPIWPVTIAHYPPQEVAPAEDKERIQPHWDRTLFSLITTSDAGDEDSEGGLQILVDKETGDGVDGRAEMEGRSTEWQKVRRPPGGFIINVGEIMSRWSNGRLKHVVHRVPNPKPGHPDLGRISLMAFVVPDYDAVVECIHCKEDGSTPIYEKTWVGEMMNWGSRLPIYNQTKMEMMRMAQGLYSTKGDQVKLGDPTDVKSLEKQLTKKAIPVLDIAALQNGTQEEQKVAARRLSEAFERTGFAVVTGHPVPPEHMRNLRIKAYQFFRSPLEEKKKFDKGKGYGFGGYNNQRESGAQLLGDFSRPVDMVESLHAGLAGLRAGVEGIQLRGTDEGAKDGHCSIKDISGCEMEESTPPVLSRFLPKCSVGVGSLIPPCHRGPCEARGQGSAALAQRHQRGVGLGHRSRECRPPTGLLSLQEGGAKRWPDGLRPTCGFWRCHHDQLGPSQSTWFAGGHQRCWDQRKGPGAPLGGCALHPGLLRAQCGCAALPLDREQVEGLSASRFIQREESRASLHHHRGLVAQD